MKTTFIRIALAALFIAGTFIIVYFGFVYSPAGARKAPSNIELDQKPGKEPPPPAGEKTPKLKIMNPELSQTFDGKVTWKLSAGKIEADTATGRGELTDARGDIFDNEGRFLTFIAPKTTYDPANKNLKVDGRFTGRLEPGGQSVSASDLLWEQSTNELTANDADIDLKDATIHGRKLRIDTASKTISLEGGVEIRIPIRKE